MQGRPLDRVLILNITIVVEALLLLIATLWSQFGEIQLLPLFHLNRHVALTGLSSGLAIASTGFALFWAAHRFGGAVNWLGNLRNIIDEDLVPLFQTLNLADIIVVAASSGFCEEVFFRGVIQNQLGLWLAAALFGFFHCPTRRHLTYGLWALCAGLFLGWLLNATGSLWAPIFAHSLSNFLVLSYLRYGRKSNSEPDSGSSLKASASSEVDSKSISDVGSKVSSEVGSKASAEVDSKTGSEIDSKAGH